MRYALTKVTPVVVVYKTATPVRYGKGGKYRQSWWPRYFSTVVDEEPMEAAREYTRRLIADVREKNRNIVVIQVRVLDGREWTWVPQRGWKEKD